MLDPEVAYLPEDDAGDRVVPRRVRRRRRRLALGSVAAVVLLGVGGVTGAWAGASSFNDVPTGHPFYSQIMWMAGHDLGFGYKDGGFHPSEPVSRQAMAVFLQRYNAEITTEQSYAESAFSEGFYETATCPAGKSAIAGGGATESDDLVTMDSQPTYTNGSPYANAWAVRWTSDTNAKVHSGGIMVWVTCKPSVN